MRILPRFMLCALAACLVSSVAGAATPPASATSAATSTTFEPGRLERVEALHDPMIPGPVPTWYTRGYEQHARDLQRFLGGERAFVRRELGVNVPLSLAVLDTKQWKLAERQLPYPMPSVTGDPPVALMPADWGSGSGFFPKHYDSDPALVKVARARGVSWDEASHRAADLIGGHELGHAVLDGYGIVPGTHWMNEMLASYVLYAYLQSDRRDLLWLVPVLQVSNQIRHPQPYMSLEDFESRYMQILSTDAVNYGWYQGQFIEQIEKVYARKGIGFLLEVRAAFPPGPKRFALGNDETLRRLEKISPGFIAWAHAMNAQPKLVAHH